MCVSGDHDDLENMESLTMSSNIVESSSEEDSKENIKYGTRQSPINVVSHEIYRNKGHKVDVEFEDLQDGTLTLNYNSLQVDYEGGRLKYKAHSKSSAWKSAQFHFHAPAEHKIDGHTYDAEMHMVFRGECFPDELAVLGILFEISEDGEPNQFIESLRLGELSYPVDVKSKINSRISDVFNGKLKGEVINYLGSLTTPGFDESVTWFLVKNPIKINDAELKNLTKFWGNEKFIHCETGNARNIRQTGSRIVQKFPLQCHLNGNHE
jgi:carbonic anhydrase